MTPRAPRALLRHMILAGAALAVSGCAASKAPPPARWTAPGASAPDALEKLRGRSESFRTVRAVLELVWRDDTGEQSEGCRGSLSWIRPDSLRLRGTSAAFFTVFDLAADARRVRLDIPREGVVVFGERDDPAWLGLPLSARELRVALMADPCETPTCRESARWESADPPVIRGADWTLALDPGTGLPVRWSHADGPGREIRWQEWSVRDGVAWPLRLEIRDPERAETLEVRMGRVDLDRSIPGARFALTIDKDREILTPAEAKARWERRGSRILHP